MACGSCYAIDPTHYVGDEEGKSKVVGGTSDGTSSGSFEDDRIEDAKAAAFACPVSVITVTET